MFFFFADAFEVSQRKMWDKNGWLDVLFEVQKKACKEVDEMRQLLSQAFVSMESVYNALSGTREIDNLMVETSEQMINLFKKREGIWKQSQWDTLLVIIQKKSVKLNDEIRVYLMNSLSNLNNFFTLLSDQTEKVERIVKEPYQVKILPHGLKELVNEVLSVSQ